MTTKKERAAALAAMTKAELIKTINTLDKRVTKLLNEISEKDKLLNADFKTINNLDKLLNARANEAVAQAVLMESPLCSEPTDTAGTASDRLPPANECPALVSEHEQEERRWQDANQDAVARGELFPWEK